jgi:hypothetical protein
MTTTPRQHPSWLLKISEAKRRAFDALSDEEKAAALNVQKGPRQRVRAKRATSLSLATQIFKLYDAGHTVDEIAAIDPPWSCGAPSCSAASARTRFAGSPTITGRRRWTRYTNTR